MLAEEEEDEADQLELIHLMSQEAGRDESQKPQPHLDRQQQEDLQQVLEEFADVFSEDPGLTERAKHHIHTGTARPTCPSSCKVAAGFGDRGTALTGEKYHCSIK